MIINLIQHILLLLPTITTLLYLTLLQFIILVIIFIIIDVQRYFFKDIFLIKFFFSDTNPCIDGTHNCTPYENCVITLNGFECHSRLLLPLPISIYPENLTKFNKKKENCDIGYAYNAYEQKCKGNFIKLPPVSYPTAKCFHSLLTGFFFIIIL